MKKKSDRKKLMDQADQLWRDCVKLRDGSKSVLSGKGGALNAHHIITRSNLATRWSLDNGLTFTSGEHAFWVHKNIAESTVWIQNYLGQEKFDNLLERSHQLVKWGVPQLRALVEELEKERRMLE
jgi:hypothetical protein